MGALQVVRAVARVGARGQGFSPKKMQRFAHIATDEKMRRFVDACRAQGLSVTHQRLAIYGVLADSTQHPSAERIFEHVRAAYPTLSLATVYKTLETLEGIGLVRKVSDLHEAALYDANLDPHHHLVCTACRTVFDYYPADGVTGLPEPGSVIEDRFQVQGYQIQLNGLCDACQAESTAS